MIPAVWFPPWHGLGWRARAPQATPGSAHGSGGDYKLYWGGPQWGKKHKDVLQNYEDAICIFVFRKQEVYKSDT